jgi:hypothetical protein
VIWKFSEAVDQKNIPQAMSYLSDNLTANDQDKQTWNNYLDSFTKFKITEIEKWNDPDEVGFYRVIYDVSLKPEGLRAIIPFYGWSEGKNFRWIRLAKNNEGLYKITEIATGP